MVIESNRIRQVRTNYFMTDEEVSTLWENTNIWSSKWRTMVALALFRGLRIGEICAINLYDFQDNYTKLRVIIEKSHIETVLPLIPQLTEIIKDYILKNKHTFKDGYLFPYYSSRGKRHLPHMNTKTADSCFCKFRKTIGKKHPAFLERNKVGKVWRYRIGWHSCRRWFETTIYENIKDRKKLSDIMRYLDSRTVDSYIDPYRTWKDEQNILQNSFNDTATNISLLSKKQTRLDGFLT